MNKLLAEGCDHDCPSRLCLVGPEKLDIPEDVKIIKFKEKSEEYKLYGRTPDFRTFNPLYLKDTSRPYSIKDSGLVWSLESLRSLLVSDGRIFVSSIYIDDMAWDWYLSRGLPDLINSMREIFRDGKDISEINSRAVRFF